MTAEREHAAIAEKSKLPESTSWWVLEGTIVVAATTALLYTFGVHYWDGFLDVLLISRVAASPSVNNYLEAILYGNLVFMIASLAAALALAMAGDCVRRIAAGVFAVVSIALTFWPTSWPTCWPVPQVLLSTSVLTIVLALASAHHEWKQPRTMAGLWLILLGLAVHGVTTAGYLRGQDWAQRLVRGCVERPFARVMTNEEGDQEVCYPLVLRIGESWYCVTLEPDSEGRRVVKSVRALPADSVQRVEFSRVKCGAGPGESPGGGAAPGK